MITQQGRHAQEFDFFGPYLGPIGITLGLPVVCYLLYFSCGPEYCFSLKHPALPGLTSSTPIFSWRALGVYLGWLSFQVLLHLLLPGKHVQGVPLANGERLLYKFTGMQNLVVTLALVFGLGFATDVLNLGWVYDNYLPLFTASLIVSVLGSVALFAASHSPWRERPPLLAAGGDTGYHIYDFFIGRELNPRIGSLDLKEFCELIPGLIGWLVIDLACAHKQLQEQGSVSVPMALVCAFQGLYVWDALYHEPAILTTMDIVSDGFGFMLAFGDTSLVPFTYSLQARLLVSRGPTLGALSIAGLIALKGLGYATFRGSNSQKDQFRRDPGHASVAHLSSLPTERGTRLLTSGWWGLSRHPNYLGDWLMAWAWCLPTGSAAGLVPYYYVIYFAALLVHRAMRDDHACRLKYGKDWDKYCKLVRWRIIPFLY
ncbi:ERG4 [Auxenochlorella protothecoides x Auxenochlorella symbiontica]